MPDPENTPTGLKKIIADMQKEMEQIRKTQERIIAAIRNYEAYEGVDILPE